MKRRNKKAFSLIEVVVALGIVTFAGFALIGLLSVGLQGNRDSKEQLQAATLAEAICSTIRATPTSNFASGYPQAGFPVPYITNSVNNLASPTYVTWDGTTTTQSNARFGVLYRVTTPTTYSPSISPATASAYLCIYWPAQASPTNVGTGRFELATSFLLP